MDIEICKKILEHRQQLVPALFTLRQVSLIQKYTSHQKLTASERTYFYSDIRRKMEALHAFREEYYITGVDMISKRVDEAKNTLKKLKYERAFISGSFLYKKEYNDIDIFIMSTRRKSYRKGNRHFTFITESDLHKPLFSSAARYSVATFPAVVNAVSKRQKLDAILFTYQWIINQILEKEDQKELRDLIFQYFLYVRNEILDARSLDLQVQEIKNLPQEQKIDRVNALTKELILKIYSFKYVYSVLLEFTKSIKKMGEEYKTANIPIFLHFAKEVQHECRRSQA